MAVYHVNTDSTASASQAMLGQVQELAQALATTDAQIAALLAEGYQTVASEQQFRPFFEQFKNSYTSVQQSLEGIGQYLRTVGDTYQQTDSQLGSTLGAV